ncbi:FAD-binding protein [Sulfitobacter aestuarii]|uniref:FAD-binding protein n=1 Tax=Sulfitobacter aestuarii TaxID=2161676 RepID=A0ABW5U5K5_9RHOB
MPERDEAVLRPQSEGELAEIIASADTPLSPRGGNTRGLSGPGRALSSAGLSGITLYEPGALTLVAQAGTSLREIDALLAAENQRLAFEPMDHRPLLGHDGEPTLGGICAANVCGPRRLAVGAARDFMLGIRCVDGSGRIIANGGRVMKNVTGYDLVRLFAGSCGTLGVLSQVALKVLPQPETQASLTLHGLDERAAVAVMARAMGSPFEVTGAAHMPGDATEDARTHLRIEGFEASVRYRIARLRALLSDAASEVSEIGAGESQRLWQRIRDVEIFANRAGDVWRLSCKPGDGPSLARRAGAEACAYDWAGGLVWLLMPPGSDLRSRLGRFEGHATYLRGATADRRRLGVLQPEPPGMARLSAGLRRQFDPKNRLNGGLLAVSL